jgi:hypothetical protein
MSRKWLFALLLFLPGCAAQTPVLYQWGSYENLIYRSYPDTGALSPEEQIQKLEAEYQVARSKNLQLPPGYYAQIGLMYYRAGKPNEAAHSFAVEAELFPESKVFMKRVIDKIKQGK